MITPTFDFRTLTTDCYSSNIDIQLDNFGDTIVCVFNKCVAYLAGGFNPPDRSPLHWGIVIAYLWLKTNIHKPEKRINARHK